MAIGIAMMEENGMAIAFAVTHDKNMYVLAVGECDTDEKVKELSSKAVNSATEVLRKGEVKESDFLSMTQLRALNEGNDDEAT